MYIGRYYHKLESKNRLSLPKIFREALKDTGIVTKGLDGCLTIFDQDTWKLRLEEANRLAQTKKSHRDFVRFLTNDARALEVDSQGRMLIASELKEVAGLEKDIVVVGSLDHIEIWDQSRYHNYMQEVESRIEDTVEGIQEVDQ